MKNLWIGCFASLVFIACGSEPSRERAPEFSSSVNVNELVYRLTEIEVSGEILYKDGTKQDFQMNLRHPQNIASELVVRKTIDNQYTLQINDKRADINIGSSGSFDSRREAQEEDGCRLQGFSKAQGEAVYNAFKLDYELNVHLRGEDCPRSVEESFVGFANRELDALNFDTLNRLRDSGTIALEGRNEILIRVRAVGVIS